MRALHSWRSWSALAVLCGSCALFSPGVARAASDEDKAGARAAATQGEAEFQAKHWAQALDLFTRAESLVHSPVHLLFKARSLLQLGQLVKANETYLAITREDATGASPAAAKAHESAAKEQAELQPRLATLTVNVTGPGAAEATLLLDGVKVPSALVGLSHPADPGQHTLVANSPTSASNQQSVTLKEGGSATLTLTLVPVPGAVAAAAPPAGAQPGAPVASPPMASGAVDAGVPSKGNGLRTASYVAFGVGGVGLVVGTLFALKAKSKYKDGNALCQTDPCSLSASDSAQRDQFGKDGDSAKTISLVGFVAGGVGVVAGATLFILSSKKGDEPTQAGVHPWIGLGSAGLSGRF